MASLIFLIIFLFIVVALIAIAVYGSFKDKKAKQIELDKLKKLESVASKGHVTAYLLLESLLNYVEDSMIKFNEDPQSVSISKVNEVAGNAINYIISSKEIKKVYELEDRRAEFKPILEELKSVKPTQWNKEAYFSIALVQAKSKNYKENPEYKNIVDKISKHKWN